MKLSIATLPTVQVRAHQREVLVFSTGRIAEIQKNDDDPLLLDSWKETRDIEETNLTPFIGELISGDHKMSVWGFLDESETIVDIYGKFTNKVSKVYAKRQNFHRAVYHALSSYTHVDTRLYSLLDSSLYESTMGEKTNVCGLEEFVNSNVSLINNVLSPFENKEHKLLRRMAAPLSYVNYDSYVPLSYDFDLDTVDIEVELHNLMQLHIQAKWEEVDEELFQNDIFDLWVKSLFEGEVDYEM